MNFEDLSIDEPLGGQLLLAAPKLTEPAFERTVLLLTNHSSTQGALGYILNRPIDKVVSDLLPEPGFGELGGIPVFQGGPVSQEHLTFASLGWNDAAGTLQFRTHLSTREANQHLKEGFSVRAFVGYSGWGEGQLENELRESAWVVKEPIREIVDLALLNLALWSDLIRDISPLHRLAADMPDDLSLN